MQLDFAFRLARHSLILLSLCTLVFASGNAPDARDVDTRLKLAHEHRLAGHSDEALDELQAVLASIKTDPELRRFQASAELEMAEIYLSRNKLREAAACFEDVIALGSNDAVVHYKLGLVYRDLGDNRRASLQLETAVNGDFSNLAAKANLVDTSFKSRRTTVALATAKEILSSEPKSPGLLLQLGEQLFDHLFYKQALRAFQLASKAAPKTFEPQFRLALTYFLLGDYPATIASLPLNETDVINAEAASLIGSAHAKLGHIDQATSILREAIKASPDSLHPYINLALIDLDQGKIGEAEALLEHIRAQPARNTAKVFYSVSRNSCRHIAGDMQESKVVEKSDPEKAEYYFQLAAQLEERFNFLSAVEIISLAYKYEGASARVLYVAGMGCFNQDQQSPEPVALLKEAIARDPAYHQAYYLLGRVYSRQGKLNEAVAMYRTAVRLHPESAYYVSLGKALMSFGNGKDQSRQDAIKAFERAATLDPTNAIAHLELGRLLTHQDELTRARAELETALELEPDFYEADYLLGRLLFQIGEEEQSRKYLALFADKKKALMEQSVIASGFASDGQRP